MAVVSLAYRDVLGSPILDREDSLFSPCTLSPRKGWN